MPGNHDVKALQKTAILGTAHTSESANVTEQKSQRRNYKYRHHKQQKQNSCNNISPRDMVCLGNMCMDSLYKGDSDDDDDDDVDDDDNNNNSNNNDNDNNGR